MTITQNSEQLLARIRTASGRIGRRARVMEVCGTHTHVIARAGLENLVKEEVDLVSGPGCPVCVTSQRDIERMILLARDHKITIATFGDMIRVPGISSSLERERADGADVRVVYSPIDALALAQNEPARDVVFLAVGFETTAPGIAAVALQTHKSKIKNFSLFVSHKLIIPAMTAVLDGEVALDGFLTPGHVSVIIGSAVYAPLAAQHSTPCVATGFEPCDVLQGLGILLEMIAEDRTESAIQYARAVTAEGNKRAQNIMMQVFEEANAEWRGLGIIPQSGLRLRKEFKDIDAEKRLDIPDLPEAHIEGCRCGDVLKGLLDPADCGLFGTQCHPGNPVGPCMVSSEGSCAARYKYG